MSRVDDLIVNYERFVKLPWQPNLAPAQRVWMAVYNPEEERRVCLRLPEFKNVTVKAGHDWAQVDITESFENWMAGHEYRIQYFAQPKLIQPALSEFFEHLVAEVRTQIDEATSGSTVVGLIGAASLFGLGDQVHLSTLIEQVDAAVEGRLLVFFPGEVHNNNYRLLGAKDGWNYLATVISADQGGIL